MIIARGTESCMFESLGFDALRVLEIIAAAAALPSQNLPRHVIITSTTLSYFYHDIPPSRVCS
jgi:hypothetical protein